MPTPLLATHRKVASMFYITAQLSGKEKLRFIILKNMNLFSFELILKDVPVAEMTNVHD